MAAEGQARGLFLRYCPACNSTSPCADRKGDCTECKAPLKIVDVCALIPTLGNKLDVGQREAAVADLSGHDRPA